MGKLRGASLSLLWNIKGIYKMRVNLSQIDISCPVQEILEQLKIKIEQDVTFSFLGKSVRFHSNSQIARNWAELYLTPFCKATANTPHVEASCTAIFLPDNTISTIITPPNEVPRLMEP